MTYMMQNAVENGTGTEARLSNMAVAGKTGTSGDYKDRWFCGVTPYYVAAVWTGFDTPATINVSGNPAAQLWKKVMQPLHAGLEYKAFTYPYIGENTGVFGIYDTYVEDETDDYGWGTSTTEDPWGNSSSDYDYSSDTTTTSPWGIFG